MKRINHGYVFIFVAAMIITICLGAPAAFASSQQEVVVDEWEIPFLNCLTGPIASIGEYMAWSAHRATKEINEAGGIAGKPVRVIDHDTGVSPEKAVQEMAKIVDSALVAMGPVPEACIMAAMPLAVRKNLFSMTASTTYEYALKYFPWTLSWYPPTEKNLPPVAALWSKSEPDMKKVVQFIEKWACWPIMCDAHAMGLKAEGIEMLDNVEVPTDAVTMGPLVVKALAKKPDGFILNCTSEKAAKLIIELDKHGWKDRSKILIFGSADDTPLYTTGKDFLNGCYIYNFLNPALDSPRWKAFKEAYEADHGGLEPTSLSTIYYDVVYMIKEAIENTGVTGDPKKLAEERVKIRDYCRNVKGFEGIQMTWDMSDGVPSNKGTFLFKIEEGKKKYVAYTESWQ